MAVQVGQVINETYQVERLLGSGGMADVYVVVHTRLPRRFALKVMRIEGGIAEPFLERFRREAEILSSLRHPHIVDVTDWNRLPDGSPYLVMELLDGEDLAALLARQPILPLPQALSIIAQIGDALEAAHAAGVVHRDLKPGNVFLQRRGAVPNHVKVLDFGVAKIVRTDRTALTGNAMLMGTPGYMAPEQALGRTQDIDPRTDQFAMAAILYEMLAGLPAFFRPDDTVYNVLSRVVQEDPAPLTEAQASPRVSQAVRRALSKRQEDRFGSVREFLAAAGAISARPVGPPKGLAGRPNTADERVGEITLGATAQVRRKLVLGAGLGGLALCLLIGGVLVARHEPAEVSFSPTDAAGSGLLHASRSDAGRTGDIGLLAAGAGEEKPLPTSPSSADLAADVVAPLGHAADPVGKADSAVQAAQPASVAKKPARSVPGAAEAEASSGGRVRAGKGGRLVAGPGKTKLIFMSTLDPTLQQIVLACAHKELADVSLPVGAALKLERSGTLQLVEAPQAVFATGFGACLHQALSHVKASELPASVVLRVGR